MTCQKKTTKRAARAMPSAKTKGLRHNDTGNESRHWITGSDPIAKRLPDAGKPCGMPRVTPIILRRAVHGGEAQPLSQGMSQRSPAPTAPHRSTNLTQSQSMLGKAARIPRRIIPGPEAASYKNSSMAALAPKMLDDTCRSRTNALTLVHRRTSDRFELYIKRFRDDLLAAVAQHEGRDRQSLVFVPSPPGRQTRPRTCSNAARCVEGTAGTRACACAQAHAPPPCVRSTTVLLVKHALRHR